MKTGIPFDCYGKTVFKEKVNGSFPKIKVQLFKWKIQKDLVSYLIYQTYKEKQKKLKNSFLGATRTAFFLMIQ